MFTKLDKTTIPDQSIAVLKQALTRTNNTEIKEEIEKCLREKQESKPQK